MRVFTVVLLGLVAATVVLAGPPSVEGDAEVVDARTHSHTNTNSRPEGEAQQGENNNNNDNNNRDGVFLYFPGLADIRNAFSSLFGRRRSGSEGNTNTAQGEGSDSEASNTEESSARGLFPSLFGGPFFNFHPLFPVNPENYTVTFRNSSLHVVNYGRVPMVVNKTIEERKGDDGSVYFSVVQTLVGPYNNSTGLNITEPSLDYADAEADDEFDVVEEPSTSLRHSLTKRWIVSWLNNKLTKRENTESRTADNHLPGTRHKDETTDTNKLEKEEEVARENTNSFNVHTEHLEKEKEGATGDVASYVGDTDVNFLGPPRAINPDAEVFDPELVREAENEFFERRYGRPGPLPIRSASLRSQPLTAQPLPSHPIAAEPLRTRPHRSHPIRSQPIRSQPLYAQPLPSHPIASESLRTRLHRSHLVSSHPLRSQPLRSQPIRSQPLRYQPLASRPLREGYVRL